jgi:hypothetical protein
MTRYNPKYAPIFAKLAEQTTEQLITCLTLLRAKLNKLNAEQVLVYSCMFDEIEARVGDDIYEIIETIDANIITSSFPPPSLPC